MVRFLRKVGWSCCKDGPYRGCPLSKCPLLWLYLLSSLFWLYSPHPFILMSTELPPAACLLLPCLLPVLA